MLQNGSIFLEGVPSSKLDFLDRYGISDKEKLIKDSHLPEPEHCSKYSITTSDLRVIKGRIQRLYKKLPIPKGFYLVNIPNNRKYAVSKEGVMINLSNRRFLSLSTDYKGYVRAVMRWIPEEGTTRNYLRVHRAVALTFLPQGGFKQVNHIDGNKLNNNVSNLEWCTGSSNVNHAHRTGLCNNKAKGTRQHLAKMDDAKVVECRKRYADGELCSHLATHYKVDNKTMNSILTKKTWRHVGESYE